MTHLRAGLPKLTANLARLPLDARGYPVPWFVQWFLPDGTACDPGVGVPDFRVADGRKREAAIRRHLCWICGAKLGDVFAFTIGPMCAVNRVAGDPPAHVSCAEFSVRACPFLARPAAERREAQLPEGVNIPGVGIMRNPGVALVWITDRFQKVDDEKGSWAMRMGSPRGLLWYAEGRQATRQEVMHSIETGLPLLQTVAERDGPEAVEQLAYQTARALELVPA